MSNYFIDLDIKEEHSEVIWSEIYLSSSLNVEMITATLPIYYEDKKVKNS